MAEPKQSPKKPMTTAPAMPTSAHFSFGATPSATFSFGQAFPAAQPSPFLKQAAPTSSNPAQHSKPPPAPPTAGPKHSAPATSTPSGSASSAVAPASTSSTATNNATGKEFPTPSALALKNKLLGINQHETFVESFCNSNSAMTKQKLLGMTKSQMLSFGLPIGTIKYLLSQPRNDVQRGVSLPQPYKGFLDAMSLNATSLCLMEQASPQIRSLPVGVRKQLELAKGKLDTESHPQLSAQGMQIPPKVREYLDALPLGVRAHLFSLSSASDYSSVNLSGSKVVEVPVTVKDEEQEKEIERLKQELKEKNAESASLAYKLEATEKQLAQSVEDSEAKGQEIKSLKHVVENTSRNFQAVKDTLAKKESELQSCHDEIKAKKKIIHELQEQVQNHEVTIEKLKNVENFHVTRRLPLLKKATAFNSLAAVLGGERVIMKRACAMFCRNAKLRFIVLWKQYFMDRRAEEMVEMSQRYRETRAKMSKVANDLVPLGTFISSSSPSIRRSFERSLISLREGYMDSSKCPPRTAGGQEEDSLPPSRPHPRGSEKAGNVLDDTENQLANCMTPNAKIVSPGDLQHTPIAADRTREIVRSPPSRDRASVHRNVPKDLIRWLQQGNLSSPH
eukprot:758541-Hanusia_phi.AAC.4